MPIALVVVAVGALSSLTAATATNAMGRVAPLAIPAERKLLGSTWQPVGEKDMAALAVRYERDPLFDGFFRLLTPEDAGKWGLAEARRGAFGWESLDRMFEYARRKNLLVKHHTFLWGLQRPAWYAQVRDAADLRTAVDDWMRAFYRRYATNGADRLLCMEAVNEPISQPPAYAEHMGGKGRTGWDWVIWAYERSRLMVREQRRIGVTIPADGIQQHRRLTELRFGEAALAHLHLDIRLLCTGIRSPRTLRPFPTRGSWQAGSKRATSEPGSKRGRPARCAGHRARVRH